jgi:hypothetical protein
MKMLTYTSLLVACLVVSVVAYFLYKVIADSSRSVYRSRAPVALLDTKGHHHTDSPGHHDKNSGVNASVTGKAKAFGENRGHTTPKNFAKTYPALPTESVTWTSQGTWQGKWQGNRGQSGKPQLQDGHAAGNTSHCSLYHVNTPQPAQRARPNIPWLQREEKVTPVGKTSKVTRRVARVVSDNADPNKPWGW